MLLPGGPTPPPRGRDGRDGRDGPGGTGDAWVLPGTAFAWVLPGTPPRRGPDARSGAPPRGAWRLRRAGEAPLQIPGGVRREASELAGGPRQIETTLVRGWGPPRNVRERPTERKGGERRSGEREGGEKSRSGPNFLDLRHFCRGKYGRSGPRGYYSQTGEAQIGWSDGAGNARGGRTREPLDALGVTR